MYVLLQTPGLCLPLICIPRNILPWYRNNTPAHREETSDQSQRRLLGRGCVCAFAWSPFLPRTPGSLGPRARICVTCLGFGGESAGFVKRQDDWVGAGSLGEGGKAERMGSH